MSTNRNLNKALAAKNDEFYTQLSDIENELKHYKRHFKGKVVFCNCDDPEKSNFFDYFNRNMIHLGIKKLITTHFTGEGPSYKIEVVRNPATDRIQKKKTNLQGNGDFRSPESVELLKQADIVVTNPPFSLFREYVALLMEHNKKFLIVGSINAVTYKNIFSLIKDNKLWLGTARLKEFVLPDGSYKSVGALWFTNLSHQKRNEDIILYKKYRKVDYPKYDNFDAIEVSKTKEIPKNFKGLMGVPISYLNCHNPDQFEIIDMDMNLVHDGKHRCYIKGKRLYSRIIIRNRNI